MKKIISILVLLILVDISAYSQESFSKQFKGKDGFSCVTIGKAAMKMISVQDMLNRGAMALGNFSNKIDRLEIVSASTREAADQLSAACSEWIKHDAFESVIDIDDQGQQASIYAKVGEDNNNIFLLLAQDEETKVIIIYGSMTLDDIQGVIGDE